jgi:hypothetical protein
MLSGLMPKLNLLNSDGKEYHWTNRPEELTEDGITPTLKFGGGGIMVWSCITWLGMKMNDFVSSSSHFKVLVIPARSMTSWMLTCTFKF